MKTLIVGGGVTGLASAAFLAAAGDDVVVLEAGSPGGVVRTLRQDGYVVELGPESIRGGAPAVGAALDLLGLRPRVVLASPRASTRYLLRGGRLEPLPSGPLGALRTPLWRRRSLLRALAEPFVPRGRGAPVSVAAFVRRRVGGLSDLTNPLMAGIYAGDPELLDAETAFARPWEWVREHGSLVRGAMRASPSTDPKGSFTFVTGMSELVEALVSRVGDRLHANTPVERLVRRSDGWTAETGSGTFSADRVVVTCAPEVAARLLSDLRLPAVPRAPVAAIHVGFPTKDVPEARGFGWLCHERERRDVLGVLWVSATFPSHAPPGHSLFRLMCGGTRHPGLVEQTDDALVDHTLAVLRDVQGIRVAPSFVHVERVLPGIPQYPVGWGRELAALRRRTNLRFAGWYWGGIGIADGLRAAQESGSP